MIKVLYIYGYGSKAEANRTSALLRKYMDKEKYEVVCYNYRQNNAEMAVSDIKSIIKEKGINLLVGSSLGGFLALTIPNIPKIVMNPCMVPSYELPKIGCSADVANTYKPYEEVTINLAEPSMTLGFFSSENELLGTKYISYFRNNGFGEPILMSSPHRVCEEAIRETVVPNIEKIWSKVANYREFLSNADNAPIWDEL